MRAKEFLKEEQRGDLIDSQKKPMVGVSFTIDGGVDLYRASMLVAGLPEEHTNIDSYSLVSGRPFIVTYCDEERDMIKQAFKKMGIPYKEMVSSESEEPDGVNTQSIVSSFKGY